LRSKKKIRIVKKTVLLHNHDVQNVIVKKCSDENQKDENQKNEFHDLPFCFRK